MLPPHIVEREDRKRLSLLEFALDRSGVDRGAWAAAFSRSEIGPVDDCLCLFRQAGAWCVEYTERGTWREIGQFPQSYDAINFLWGMLLGRTSPYDCREAWEAQTGQEFSMVD
jgi:hypothetical protein